MLRHNALLNSASLNPCFILKIQLSKEEEMKMGVVDEVVTSYRAEHPGLFPEGEELATIRAKAKDTQVSKKRH